MTRCGDHRILYDNIINEKKKLYFLRSLLARPTIAVFAVGETCTVVSSIGPRPSSVFFRMFSNLFFSHIFFIWLFSFVCHGVCVYDYSGDDVILRDNELRSIRLRILLITRNRTSILVLAKRSTCKNKMTTLMSVRKN